MTQSSQRRIPLLLAACALSAGAALSTSSASAQSDGETANSHAIGGARPEFHASVGGHGDFGAGFRVDLPIVPSGFLRNGRDEFALSPGLDVQFVDFDHDDGEDNDLLLLPQLATQWNIYFPRGWSIFPELGLAVVIGDDHHGHADNGNDVHVDGLVAFGARRHFSNRTALVMRAGFPNGFSLGFTI